VTPEEMRRDLREWLAERPDDVRALARRFPPACKVEALRPLLIPAPGEVGVVISYGERSEETPDGWLGVISPGGILGISTKAVCTPDELKVVGFGEVTAEDVADALAGLERTETEDDDA
jgi:hypothetical protein